MMTYFKGLYDKRREHRVSAQYPVSISIGSQLTLQGQIRNLSLRSAFINVKNSVFLQNGDELNFVIQCSSCDSEAIIQGVARVSRLVAGEGVAVYFVKMDDASQKHLHKILH